MEGILRALASGDWLTMPQIRDITGANGVIQELHQMHIGGLIKRRGLPRHYEYQAVGIDILTRPRALTLLAVDYELGQLVLWFNRSEWRLSHAGTLAVREVLKRNPT